MTRFSRVVACLGVATAVWFGQQALWSPAAPAATAWTGTWAVSPQSSGTTFAQQTLRQIVHTSISGSAAIGRASCRERVSYHV